MKRLAGVFAALAMAVLCVAVLAVIRLEPPAGTEVEPPALSGRITRIVVDKSARQMTFHDGSRVLKTYRVALGFAPEGDKQRQGDGRTPEGVFRIDRKNAASAYTLSLGLDYPQAEDRARAKAGGYDPGGDIMIHGQPNALPDATVLKGDWTAGCIAVSNTAIREIFAATEVGAVVEIRP